MAKRKRQSMGEALQRGPEIESFLKGGTEGDWKGYSEEPTVNRARITVRIPSRLPMT
jgi:hypothetical protein